MSKIPEKITLMLIDSLRYDCIGYQPDKKHLDKENVTQFLDLEQSDIKHENEFSPMMDEEIKEQEKVMMELRKLGYL